MRILWTLMVVLMVMGWAPFALATEKVLLAKTINVPIESQPWQVRRAEFMQIMTDILTSDDNGKVMTAAVKLDEFLTALENNPRSITPMEAMDVYGLFYVPKEGQTNMKAVLTMVSIYATLGWYDVLRYASASGRAEIINNERFFARPFLLGGGEGIAQLRDYLTSHPREAEEAVAEGTDIARRGRNGERRDQDWPTAYGMERMLCAIEGEKDCPKPPAMPKEKWDAAFEDAVAQVKKYYRDNSANK